MTTAAKKNLQDSKSKKEMASAVTRFPAPRKPSRASAERRVETILDAAIEVIGTAGPSALSHRSVARVAQAPLGSMTYYFSDLEDLKGQAVLRAVSVESERLCDIVDSFDGTPSVDSAVDILVKMFFVKTMDEPIYELALFELFLDAARDPLVRPITKTWTGMILDLIDRILPPTIPAIAREHATSVVAALVDGLMIEAAANQMLSLPDIEERLRGVIASISA